MLANAGSSPRASAILPAMAPPSTEYGFPTVPLRSAIRILGFFGVGESVAVVVSTGGGEVSTIVGGS